MLDSRIIALYIRLQNKAVFSCLGGQNGLFLIAKQMKTNNNREDSHESRNRP